MQKCRIGGELEIDWIRRSCQLTLINVMNQKTEVIVAKTGIAAFIYSPSI